MIDWQHDCLHVYLDFDVSWCDCCTNTVYNDVLFCVTSIVISVDSITLHMSVCGSNCNCRSLPTILTGCVSVTLFISLVTPSCLHCLWWFFGCHRLVYVTPSLHINSMSLLGYIVLRPFSWNLISIFPVWHFVIPVVVVLFFLLPDAPHSWFMLGSFSLSLGLNFLYVTASVTQTNTFPYFDHYFMYSLLYQKNWLNWEISTYKKMQEDQVFTRLQP